MVSSRRCSLACAFTLGLALLVWLGCGKAMSEDASPTHWRFAHDFLIAPEAPGRQTLSIQSYVASSGYPDPLYYVWIDSRGDTLARGTLAPGQLRNLRVSCGAAGVHRLRVDPGRNAFSLSLSAPWCADLNSERTLHTIYRMRRLYFMVARRTRELPLKIDSDEASRLRFRGPNGELVKEQSHEQFKAVEFTIPVLPGQDGRLWSVEADLSEDLTLFLPSGIIPYAAERPEWAAQGPRWGRTEALVSFDERLTGRRELLAIGATGPPVGTLSTGDGLVLGLDKQGRVATLKLDGQEQAVLTPPPLTGFLVRDVAGDDRLLPVAGRVCRTSWGFEELLGDKKRGLRIAARWIVRGRAVFVQGEVADTTGRDRALCIVLALPIRTSGRRWCDGLDSARPLTGRRNLATYVPDTITVGAGGRVSQYPLACISGSSSLAWAVPLDQPRVFRLGCSPATGQAYAAFDLGLSARVLKSPQRAKFSVVVYRSDPAWGFRAALKRYYDLFPDVFELRMKDPGGWVCWGNLETIPHIEDYGFRYHWGPPEARSVAVDNRLGLPAFLYNDSVRYYCDLGEFESQPSEDEARKRIEAFLDNPDPVSAWLSAPPKGETAKDDPRIKDLLADSGRDATNAWAKRAQTAVKASAMRDAQGRIAVGYVVHYEGAFPPKWWTGRVSCDLDPDIPGGFGQFQLHEVIQPTFDLWHRQGGRLSGVGLDNYYVDANRLDYSTEHLAYADLPACFTRDGQRVVLLGAFETYEWTASLAAWLRDQGGYLMNNACVLPFPFDVPLMDIVGFEWNLESQAAVARVLCYHKPIVSLPMASEHWDAPWIERCHVRFAAIPGGYAGCDTPQRRTVYRRYIPALMEMARAGWEPVTRARSNLAGVYVERFGGESPSAPLLLSVTNTTKASVSAAITVDRSLAAHLPASVPDLVHEAVVPVRKLAGGWVLEVKLSPGQAAALRLR